MTQQPDWLVQTKLQPPLLHADTIARRGPLDALRTAVATRPVTLISAPAGYGKTTLLASLPGLLPELHLAWLTLDEEDNDPGRFLAALITSLERLHPAVGEGARQHLATDPRRVVALLINAIMAHLPEPFALVLDDLHFVTEPRVHAALDFLIERLPTQMRLVIGTRHDPPLALARLIARRQVAEVRRPHLSFTPDEVRLLLNDTLGLDLSEADLRALTVRTEGWAAGLCLLASSLERIGTEAGRSALLTGLTQTDRYVFDFLAAEVLHHQEPATRAFLLQTSILAELTAPLCAAVTQRPAAGQVLDALYRQNLFLVVDESGAYRYHALFAEFLRRELAQEQPELIPELHRRAAAAQPSRTRAISHLLAARLYEEAAALIAEVGERLLLMGLASTLRTWGQQLPPAVKEAQPRLCFILSRAFISLGDYPGAYTLANHAREGCTRAGDLQGQAIALNALCSIAMLMGDVAACRQWTDRFGELPNLPLPLQARRLSIVGYLHGCDHQWAASAAAIQQAMALATASGDLSAVADISFRLGPWAAALPDSLPAVERFYRWAEEQAPADRSALRLVAADRLAWIELLRGRADAARAAAEAALALKEQIGGYVWLGLASCATLTTIATARGDHAAAAAHLDALLRLIETVPADQAQIWSYLAGRTYCLLGQLEPARRWLLRMQDPAARHGFAVGPALQLRLTGLIALGEGRPAEAASAFRAAVDAEAESPITRLTGSARVLLIRALLELHQAAAARTKLAELLRTCVAESMPGLLLQEGRLILPLLQEAAQAPGPGSEVAAAILPLLGATPAPGAPPAPVTGSAHVPRETAQLPEPLTDRELDVLRLLAAGATNRTIAEALIIGDETVKTHVARILRKLDVPARAEAAARARELGLI